MRALSVGAVVIATAACEPQFVDAVGVAVQPDAGPEAGMEGGTEAGTTQPPPSLLHRYRFDGTGTLVADSKGAAHGTVVGTELDGSGSLTLAGTMTGQYVDLPDGLISGLTDATFEAWISWRGGVEWQRIFDFGSMTSSENAGWRYLFLTPRGYAPGALRLVYSIAGSTNETVVEGPVSTAVDSPSHVVAVIDELNGVMKLYLDGELQGSEPFLGRLSYITDTNNWLGRSNFPADNYFDGTFHDFRIYDGALSAEQIRQSFAAGPDARLVGEP